MKYLVGLFSVLCTAMVDGQQADTWDYCNCYWGTWNSWSSCTKTCGGGYKERSRLVWHRDVPECSKWENCAQPGSGWDYTRCNTNCFNGGSIVEWGTVSGYCSCISGHLGNCCETIVTCGYPGNINNGRVAGTDYTYNKEVSYLCNEKYNLTGNASRRCTLTGSWSGSTPTCIFTKHCESSPCQNDATCVDGLGFYTCMCGPGWTGKTCDVDIQPALVEGCSDNFQEFVTSLSNEIRWPTPTFTDPMGTSLIVQSNYYTNSSIFPWGDFTVQYVATKTANGLVTECVFNISIRPNPCNELRAPTNGILLCNGWKKDYYHLCLFSCLSGFSLPQGFSPSQWYICGASGNWFPASTPIQCYEIVVGLTFGSPADSDVSNCSDVTPAQEYYVEKLNSSEFSLVCTDNPSECLAESVDILCL